jgi:two-component sensor histidine kinase
MPSKSAASFEIVFSPRVELISLVRSFVSDFYAKVVADPDSASRLAVATHELLENAAKYSLDGEAALFVEFDRDRDFVTIRTVNRATNNRIKLLERTFAEISRASNARALYRTAIRRTARSRSRSGGLGLARIWAESEMELRLLVRGNRVEIHASGQLAAA